jgi:hypothetical protein
MDVGVWGITVKPLHVHASPIANTPNTTVSSLPLDTFLEVVITTSLLVGRTNDRTPSKRILIISDIESILQPKPILQGNAEAVKTSFDEWRFGNGEW